MKFNIFMTFFVCIYYYGPPASFHTNIYLFIIHVSIYFIALVHETGGKFLFFQKLKGSNWTKHFVRFKMWILLFLLRCSDDPFASCHLHGDSKRVPTVIRWLSFFVAAQSVTGGQVENHAPPLGHLQVQSHEKLPTATVETPANTGFIQVSQWRKTKFTFCIKVYDFSFNFEPEILFWPFVKWVCVQSRVIRFYVLVWTEADIHWWKTLLFLKITPCRLTNYSCSRHFFLFS